MSVKSTSAPVWGRGGGAPESLVTPKALVAHLSEAVRPLTRILRTQYARVESRRMLGPIQRTALAHLIAGAIVKMVLAGPPKCRHLTSLPSYQVPEQRPQESRDAGLARSSPGTFQRIRG